MTTGETLLANARMYAVDADAEAAWRDLFAAVAERSGVALAYRPHPPPAPLETLWERDDLGLAFMCGWPFAATWTDVQPVAVPRPAGAGGPFYRTDLVVRAENPAASVPELFGTGRIGWTVEHSQSGFNALRHHLLGPRRQRGAPLFAASVGPLVTPRRVIEALLADQIDVGPLDSYWHALLRRFEPRTAARLRVLERTRPTAMPLLIASPGTDPETIRRLREALLALGGDPVSRALLDRLGLDGFVPATRESYRELVEQAEAAEAASYCAVA